MSFVSHRWVRMGSAVCRTLLLLLLSSLRAAGRSDEEHDGWRWERGGRGGEHANAASSAALRRRRPRGRGGGMTGGGGGWREGWRDAVLPVAVGHGVLSLLLLEQLRDGQQLFQHVLRRGRKTKGKERESQTREAF